MIDDARRTYETRAQVDLIRVKYMLLAAFQPDDKQ
jgi:hypothetical protein